MGGMAPPAAAAFSQAPWPLKSSSQGSRPGHHLLCPLDQLSTLTCSPSWQLSPGRAQSCLSAAQMGLVSHGLPCPGPSVSTCPTIFLEMRSPISTTWR